MWEIDQSARWKCSGCCLKSQGTLKSNIFLRNEHDDSQLFLLNMLKLFFHQWAVIMLHFKQLSHLHHPMTVYDSVLMQIENIYIGPACHWVVLLVGFCSLCSGTCKAWWLLWFRTKTSGSKLSGDHQFEKVYIGPPWVVLWVGFSTLCSTTCLYPHEVWWLLCFGIKTIGTEVSGDHSLTSFALPSSPVSWH